MRYSILAVALASFSVACGGSNEPADTGSAGAPAATGGSGGGFGAGTGGSSGGGPSGGTGGGSSNPPPATGFNDNIGQWQTLIDGEWSLPPGSEDYFCVTRTIGEDVFISGFEAINPVGTHHTVLTLGTAGGPDSITKCSAFTNHTQQIYGSGVGTNSIDLPPGVAVKIPAGTQLLLNLHLFNTTAEEMTGLSGTRIKVTAADDVVHEAEGILAGTLNLNIPPMQESTQTGSCVMSRDVSVFAVTPHMHQLGIHMKVTAHSSIEGDVVLHDGPYDFEEQLTHLLDDEVQMARGDDVQVECTYRNTTTRSVSFGDSSLQEMCFAGLFRYPATGEFFVCSF